MGTSTPVLSYLCRTRRGTKARYHTCAHSKLPCAGLTNVSPGASSCQGSSAPIQRRHDDYNDYNYYPRIETYNDANTTTVTTTRLQSKRGGGAFGWCNCTMCRTRELRSSSRLSFKIFTACSWVLARPRHAISVI